ncbi:MAG: hypothetical protein HQK81_02195 [Desulfovibrionaceae bacterium]|nr:hypothetical protein [Desulfovibrionaceae bacterium]
MFRFRYEHFFNNLPDGFPGVDHAARLVFEPHDLEAVHLCAFDARGELAAVSTAVPATLKTIPPAWADWFDFAGLGSARLAKAVVSTRLVVHPSLRRTDFFARFHGAVLAHYREAGIAFTLHYCRPELAALYESLGHRRFHRAFDLLPGQPRVPMILALGEFIPGSEKYLTFAPGGGRRLAPPKAGPYL